MRKIDGAIIDDAENLKFGYFGVYFFRIHLKIFGPNR